VTGRAAYPGGSATHRFWTPLALDTHANRAPVGDATSSVGNGADISVSMDNAVCARSATAAEQRRHAARSL
jgi:hypothetical protein